MSPLLWNLVLNDLLSTLNHQECRVTSYADDLILLVTGKLLPPISGLQENDMSGLAANPQKTELILFRYKSSSF